MHMRSLLAFSAPLALIAGLTGCPDPDQDFDAFHERYCQSNPDASGCRETASSSGVGGGCTPPAAGDADGDYFLALTPAQSKKKPAPFIATITTMDAGGTLQFSMTLQPVDAEHAARMLIGPPQDVGTFDVGMDGTFAAALAGVNIPPETNPISDNPLVADATLLGTLCEASMNICGTFTGMVTMPFALPLEGEYNMELIVGGMHAEPPVKNCAGDLADPLPP
jgi:hypothetical protein